MILLLVSALALSITGAAPDQEHSTSPDWKSGVHTIKVDGHERSFILDVPEKLQPGAALVMVFHGYQDSPEAIRRYAGLTPLVEKHGFVAVYPQGTRDKDGAACFNVGYDFQKKMRVDDVKFARKIAALLVRDLKLDERSVFATGMSNGADMCYFLACQPRPFVKAIAPVAGCMLVAWTKDFKPSERMSVMEVHGTKDKLTPWAGDLANRDGSQSGAYHGTEAVMAFWKKGLSLERNETIELGKLNTKKKQLTVYLYRWWTTADDVEVRLYRIQDGGHIWPENLGNKELSTAAEIWDFFRRHRRGKNQ